MADRMEDVETLKELCKELNEITKSRGISLSIVEIKGTTFFFPQLPAEAHHG